MSKEKRQVAQNQRVKHLSVVYNIDVTTVIRQGRQTQCYAVIWGMEMNVWPIKAQTYDWTTDEEEYQIRMSALDQSLQEGPLDKFTLKKRKGKHTRDKRWERSSNGRPNVDRNDTH